MEVINHQYIIEKQKSSHSYIVTDQKNAAKKKNLHILNPAYLSGEFITYYKQNYIRIKSMYHPNILQNDHFNRVHYINEHALNDELYYMTSQYVEGDSIYHYIERASDQDLLALFVQICRAINYMHVKGYPYGSVTPDKVIVKDGKCMLLDIGTAILSSFKTENRIDEANIYYHHPLYLKQNRPTIQTDLYSLGVMLLTLLTRQQVADEPMLVLDHFQQSKGSDQAIYHLCTIIRKLLTTNQMNAYDSIVEFMNDLEQVIKLPIPFMVKEDYEQLNDEPKIIGREEELQKIFDLHASHKMDKKKMNVIHLMGTIGAGKTRLLKEITYQLEMANETIFTNVTSQDYSDDKIIWLDFVYKLYLKNNRIMPEEAMIRVRQILFGHHERSELDLLKKENEEELSDLLFHAIKKYMTDDGQHIAFVIDDIHELSFFTISLLRRLYINMNDHVFLLLASNDQLKLREDSPLSKVKRIGKAHTMHLSHLNKEDCAMIVKEMLYLPFIPKRLGKRVYEETNGNPLFLFEIVKHLFKNKVFHIDVQTGAWLLNLPEDENFSSLVIPSTIEEVILNQINEIQANARPLLNLLSIFEKPVTKRTLVDLGIYQETVILQEIAHLQAHRLIRSYEDGKDTYYELIHKTLKQVVYDKLNDKKRRHLHLIVANYLIHQLGHEKSDNYLPIIYHAKRSKSRELTKKYYMLHADAMNNLRKTKGEIQALEEAYILSKHIKERIDIDLRVGALYAEIGNMAAAESCIKQAIDSAQQLENHDHINKAYLQMANIFTFSTNSQRIEEYLALVEEDFLIKHKSFQQQYDWKRAISLVGRHDYTESKEILLVLKRQQATMCQRLYGDVCRLLGYIALKLNDHDKALSLFEEALKELREINYPRGILLSLNNIGVIYSYHSLHRAIDIFKEVRELSATYENAESEMFAEMNVGSIYNQLYELDMSYECYKRARVIAKQSGLKNQVYYIQSLLIPLLIRMGNYELAYEYFMSAHHNYADDSIPLYRKVDLYISGGWLFEVLGDLKQANRCYERVLTHEKNEESMAYNIARASLHLHQIQQTKQITDEQIVMFYRYMDHVHDKERAVYLYYRLTSLLNDCQDMNNLRESVARIKAITDDIDAPDLQSAFLITKSFTMSNLLEKKKMLDEATQVAYQSKNYLTLVRAKDMTSTIDLKQSNIYNALTNLLEVFEIIKVELKRIPEQYKQSYIHHFEYENVYDKLVSLQTEMIPNLDLSLKEKDEKPLIEKMFQEPFIERFSTYEPYMNHMANKSRRRHQVENESILELLAHITNDSETDLEKILAFIASKLMADQAVIVKEEQQKYQIISESNLKNKLPFNHYIFQRVKEKKQPVILTRQMNDSLERETFSITGTIMCVPIMPNNDQDKTVLGYLYLETNEFIHQFNDKGIEQCRELIPYLALLLEKYHLELAASIDEVTRVYTRKYIERKLHESFKHAFMNEDQYSLILFDLDHFKQVNDQYGHQVGDRILRQVCDVVSSQIKEGMYLGRYGGEEFIILLPYKDASEAMLLGERVRKAVEQKVAIAHDYSITISVGVATYPSHVNSEKMLIEEADKALYMAKKQGRNTVVKASENNKFTIDYYEQSDMKVANEMMHNHQNMIALIDIIHSLNDHKSFHERVYMFLNNVIETIGAKRGYFIGVDQSKPSFMYGRELKNKQWLSVNQKKANELIQQFNADPSIMVIIDVDQLLNYEIDLATTEVSSIINIPLFQHNRLIGILSFTTPTHEKIFGMAERSLVHLYKQLAIQLMHIK